MKTKRGISPLIATLLLISFAIALGVVVMNFGRAQVELEAQCPIEIGMEFVTVEKVKDICYESASKKLLFNVENGVNIKLTGLLVNIIDEEKAQTIELNDAKMARAGTFHGKINYDKTGNIKQVKITPKAMFYDEEQICVEKSLIVENVNEC